MGKRNLGKHKKSSKRTRSRDSSSSSSGSSSSLSSIDEKTKRKLKKKIKKLRKKEKLKKKAEKKALKKLMKSNLKEVLKEVKKTEAPSSSSCDVDVSLMEKSKSLAPMTKEEWEKQQNTFKRVFDEETGRTRLVKGTGEIVEECVSRERHLAINKQATRGDDKMEKSDLVEEFYGVYLLKCLNPKYKGQTYIGYTVDPNRRIKQHNKGKLYGGARRTSKRGPWEMTLTVHGFPSDIAALRFEWAWQHPTRSRRLKSLIKKKKSSETSFQYYLKVMFTMLKVPPWCRLPLTLRWLSADVMVDPPADLAPPMHMPIIYGPVVSKKLNSPKKKTKSVENSQEKDKEEEFCICKLCHDLANKNETLICLKNECQAKWHVVCLAKYFLERESSFVGNQAQRSEAKNILPVEGPCTECDSVMLWGDLGFGPWMPCKTVGVSARTRQLQLEYSPTRECYHMLGMVCRNFKRVMGLEGRKARLKLPDS